MELSEPNIGRGRADRGNRGARAPSRPLWRVIGSADLVRDGGQDAIHRAAVDVWATQAGGTSASDG
jgi:hypothetical protein